jgi:hypothetical protein
VATLKELPAYVSKKVWFLLFNLGALVFEIVTGALRWEVSSVIANGIALLFVNWMTLIASRKYKGKYPGW